MVFRGTSLSRAYASCALVQHDSDCDIRHSSAEQINQIEWSFIPQFEENAIFSIQAFEGEIALEKPSESKTWNNIHIFHSHPHYTCFSPSSL